MYARTTGRNLDGIKRRSKERGGRITAAGVAKEVCFEPVEGAILGRIDRAYEARYKGSPYLNPMIVARARSATVKVVPRESKQ